jgi:hypothetical protein
MCTILLTSIGGEADLQPYYGVTVVYLWMYVLVQTFCMSRARGRGAGGWEGGMGEGGSPSNMIPYRGRLTPNRCHSFGCSMEEIESITQR